MADQRKTERKLMGKKENKEKKAQKQTYIE